MRQSESHQISVVTASLAFFDETALAARGAESQWFAFPKKVLEEIRKGRLVTLDLPMDGEYSVRLTKRGLRPKEEAVATAVATTWLDVPSGRLECADVCGVPSPEAPRLGEAGRATLTLDPGRYVLRIWALPLDDDLQELPHLVIGVSMLHPGVRAPRRPVAPITPWGTRPRTRRKERPSPAASERRSDDDGEVILSGRLSTIGTIALFDAGDLGWVREVAPDWYADEGEAQRLMSQGHVLLIRAHGEGHRFADIVVERGRLPPPVVARAKALRGGWLRLGSGRLAFGELEHVARPGKRPKPAKRWTIELPPGDYAVQVAALASERAKKTGTYHLAVAPLARGQTPAVDSPPNVFSRRS